MPEGGQNSFISLLRRASSCRGFSAHGLKLCSWLTSMRVKRTRWKAWVFFSQFTICSTRWVTSSSLRNICKHHIRCLLCSRRRNLSTASRKLSRTLMHVAEVIGKLIKFWKSFRSKELKLIIHHYQVFCKMWMKQLSKRSPESRQLTLGLKFSI